MSLVAGSVTVLSLLSTNPVPPGLDGGVHLAQVVSHMKGPLSGLLTEQPASAPPTPIVPLDALVEPPPPSSGMPCSSPISRPHPSPMPSRSAAPIARATRRIIAPPPSPSAPEIDPTGPEHDPRLRRLGRAGRGREQHHA